MSNELKDWSKENKALIASYAYCNECTHVRFEKEGALCAAYEGRLLRVSEFIFGLTEYENGRLFPVKCANVNIDGKCKQFKDGFASAKVKT